MRKNFGPYDTCYPVPVLIIGTYNADGSPNAMNAGTGGISAPGRISICIDGYHKTAENLLQRKAFTVSIATADHVTACDYVGIASGNNTPDKFARAGFHAVRSEYVDAPLICELPLTLECRPISYDPQTGSLVGEIVNVSADEAILGEDGKIDVRKLKPITFDPVSQSYLVLGEKVGNAFKDGIALR